MIDTVTITEVWTTDAIGQADDYRYFREWTPEADDYISQLEGIGKYVHVTQYKVGECYCGETVELSEFTNECADCGLLYNMFGQELRPENEWEEYA